MNTTARKDDDFDFRVVDLRHDTDIYVVGLRQGTKEWLEHRAKHYNASDAPAMLGLSRYKTRQQLLRETVTGVVPDVDEETQRRFDRGHELEAIARPWAEEIIGAELFPVVLSGNIDGLPLSASLDGLTMLADVAFEHKTGRADLLESLEEGIIPDEYKPQMEQCLLLSGATRCLFMASNGDRETMRYAWYEQDSAVRKKLLAGWKQFAEDLANYQHVEVIQPAVADPQMSLPAVFVKVNGSIALDDNLSVFGEALTAYVEQINKKPQTDQDFVNLEAAVKTLKKAEDALDAAESSALGQVVSVDAMRRTVALYREMARNARLMIEKLVKAEKENRRAKIILDAQDAIMKHIDRLNERVGGWMPKTIPSFADTIKGLKSLDSMRDKVSTALANAKIEANELADRIEFNDKQRTVDGVNYSYLVPDFGQICIKPKEDFAAIVAQRIAEHKAAEAEIMAATKRESSATDQLANASESTHVEQSATTIPREPLDSRQPPRIDDALIDDFLSVLEISARERNELRPILVKFEIFRMTRNTR